MSFVEAVLLGIAVFWGISAIQEVGNQVERIADIMRRAENRALGRDEDDEDEA